MPYFIWILQTGRLIDKKFHVEPVIDLFLCPVYIILDDWSQFSINYAYESDDV